MAVKIIVFMLAWLTAEAKWTHHLVLDQQELFHLFWTPSEETIRFEIQVKTQGYVAIGFSPNGGMSGSDIILGWIDVKPHATALFPTFHTMPSWFIFN